MKSLVRKTQEATTKKLWHTLIVTNRSWEESFQSIAQHVEVLRSRHCPVSPDLQILDILPKRLARYFSLFRLTQSPQKIDLDFLAHWKDKGDYYFVHFEPIENLLSTIEGLQDREYPDHAFSLCYKRGAIQIWSFYGRKEFFDELVVPRPVISPESSVFLANSQLVISTC